MLKISTECLGDKHELLVIYGNVIQKTAFTFQSELRFLLGDELGRKIPQKIYDKSSRPFFQLVSIGNDLLNSTCL